MAELKTKPTGENVEAFLNRIPDLNKRQDAFTILELMRKATHSEPRMWGPIIVGFGDTRLKYRSGRELNWFQIGFSPHKYDLTLFLKLWSKRAEGLLRNLGKHNAGKGCLYLRRLDDVDLPTLKQLIDLSADGH